MLLRLFLLMSDCDGTFISLSSSFSLLGVCCLPVSSRSIDSVSALLLIVELPLYVRFRVLPFVYDLFLLLIGLRNCFYFRLAFLLWNGPLMPVSAVRAPL